MTHPVQRQNPLPLPTADGHRLDFGLPIHQPDGLGVYRVVLVAHNERPRHPRRLHPNGGGPRKQRECPMLQARSGFRYAACWNCRLPGKT